MRKPDRPITAAVPGTLLPRTIHRGKQRLDFYFQTFELFVLFIAHWRYEFNLHLNGIACRVPNFIPVRRLSISCQPP